MRTLFKSIPHALWKIGLLLGAILLCFAFIFHSYWGARSTFWVVNKFSPVTITYDAFSGTLSGPMHFDKLTVETSDLLLRLQQTAIQWDLKHLLYGVLEIDKLKIKQLDAHRLDTQADKAESQSLALNEIGETLSQALPFRLVVRAFDATNIRLIDSNLEIKHLTFEQGDTHRRGLFKQLHAQGPFGSLDLQNEESFDLSWHLTIPALEHWWDDLQGDIQTHGHLTIKDLSNPKASASWALSLKSQSLQLPEHVFKGLALNGTGTYADSSMHIEGEIDGHAIKTLLKGQGQQKAWLGTLQPTHWVHPKWGKMPGIDGTFKLKWGSDILGEMVLNLSAQNRLSGEFTINPKDYGLTGHLNGKLDDFELLSKIYPEFKKIQGHVSVDLSLGGHVHRPKLWGQSHFHDVRVPFAELNTELYFQDLILKGQDNGHLDIQGKGQMGGGDFSLKGHAVLGENVDLNLDLQGDNMVLSHTPEYFLKVNPNLHFKHTEKGSALSGHVLVPKAHIEIHQLSEYISPSSDVVVVKDKQSLKKPVSKATPWLAFQTNVSLELGEDIHFTGYGLDTDLTGQLDLQGLPHETLMASGKIYLENAHYQARTSKLDISHGQLIYAHTALSNPALDVKAQKTVPMSVKEQKTNDRNPFQPHHQGPQDIQVSLNLSGTLKKPELRLYSSPRVPQGDILSYLLLDKPQSEASITEGKLLFEAAHTLWTQFGGSTQDMRPSLSERFHLDKLELKTNQTAQGSNPLEDTVLVVGKQLSSRLYAEYSLGLGDTSSTLHLRYLVGKHVTLETQASKDSIGGDILWVFESG